VEILDGNSGSLATVGKKKKSKYLPSETLRERLKGSGSLPWIFLSEVLGVSITPCVGRELFYSNRERDALFCFLVKIVANEVYELRR